MSKTTLKKHLLSLTKEQIIEQVLGLYDTCKPAKEYFEYFLKPDEKGQFEKYKAIIINEFYPKGKYVEAKTRFSVAKKAIADFRSLNPSPELLGDLMVTLPEMACEFTFDYGDMWEQYYISAATNFDLALKFLEKHGLLEQFEHRCQDCVKHAEPCGYGFADEIGELFYRYYE
jgi:hypothetical protein